MAATVAAREDKILAAGREIGQIIGDWRSHLVGGMENVIMGVLLCAQSAEWGRHVDTDIGVYREKIKHNSKYFPTTGLSDWTGITTGFDGLGFGGFRYVPTSVG